MRKGFRVAIITLVLILVVPITAFAATPRSLLVIPQITFQGRTATCALTVTTESTDNQITATIKLWDGDNCLETWNASGAGYLFFDENYTVKHAGEFTLTADVTINGVARPQVSADASCE